ncbi:MAG: class I SAM-dependent methyltransferase [Hyphomonadaceae bacterium]|nr:class I SAM-dependent methyltransferase [Hyphomonadaceae bacterium]
MNRADTPAFTPALGHAALTPLYDLAIALMTREQRWRAALVAQIAPHDDDVILDVGCGTGSLLMLMARAAPGATLLGLDPDADVLRRAADKAARSHATLHLEQGFARDVAAFTARAPSKIVSSLVFHQTSLAEKEAALNAIFHTLRPGGELHIADYGLQRTPLMRRLFGIIQHLDGVENTTPNAKGVLPELMREAGFADVTERAVVATPTGSISLYFARKPLGGRAG